MSEYIGADERTSGVPRIDGRRFFGGTPEEINARLVFFICGRLKSGVMRASAQLHALSICACCLPFGS